MVRKEEVPRRRVPEGFWMAMGTLRREMFSRTREAAVGGRGEGVQAVLMARAVLVKVLSRRVTEPTVRAEGPPPVRSMPRAQLLMLRPMYVHPQFQIWMMAGGGLVVDWEDEEAGHTGLAVVKGQVAHRVLLVSHAGARGTTVKGKICHDTAAAFFNEQTNVNDIGRGGHVEYDVLEVGRLGGRPVHARGRLPWWNGPRVNHKVTDLSEEDVDGLPVEVGGVVRISVDQPEALKVGGSLERGRSRGIADELGKVGRLDGSRDQVGAGGEVDKCRRGCRRCLLVSVVFVLGTPFSCPMVLDLHILGYKGFPR